MNKELRRAAKTPLLKDLANGIVKAFEQLRKEIRKSKRR